MRIKHLAPLFAAAVLSISAQAQTLLVDRGLPTANLNNAAGANRSNVAWGYASLPWLVGDSVEVASSETFTKIRLWTIQSADLGNFNYTSPSSYQLYLGVGDYVNTNLAAVASSATITSVTYSGGSTYQGSGGSFINLLQLDFTINVSANAGDVLFFALGGTGSSSPYLHSSNAGLSGSTQDGADGLILAWDKTNFSNWGSIDTNGNGWDKSSDVNVQLFGAAVPEPTTYGLIGSAALVGLIVLRRRRS